MSRASPRADRRGGRDRATRSKDHHSGRGEGVTGNVRFHAPSAGRVPGRTRRGGGNMAHHHRRTRFRARAAVILVAGVLVGVLAPAARAAAPTVSGFSPASGPVGTPVTITGTGFTGSGSTCTSTTVKFNGVSSGCTFVSTTQLKTTVPALASTGPISVTNAGGTGTSSTNFTVTLGITISPASGPPRTVVAVNGSGFAANELVDIYFDVIDMVVAVAGSNGTFAGMSFHVPRTAEPGVHWITAGGRQSGKGAQKSFTVRTNWHQRGRVARHTGKNPWENVLDPGTVSDLEEAWHGTTGGAVESSPAVANGVVYVGSDDRKLYAFPASCGTSNATCTPLWHGTTGGAVRSSPAVVNGVVYVASNDGNLYAFPASCGTGNATCSPLWHGTTGNVIESSPAVANGVVYVGSDDTSLYAFPASCGTGNATCSPLWHGPAGDYVRSSPAVANGVVYVGSDFQYLYAFPASCGTGNAACSPLWIGTTTGFGTHVPSSPAVANGVAYVAATDGNLYAFPASCGTGNASCSPLWSSHIGSPIVSSPAVSDGVVYVGSNDGQLYAFDLAAGSAGVPRPALRDLRADRTLRVRTCAEPGCPYRRFGAGPHAPPATPPIRSALRSSPAANGTANTSGEGPG